MTTDPLWRARVLPAYIEIMLTVGGVQEALRVESDREELDAIIQVIY